MSIKKVLILVAVAIVCLFAFTKEYQVDESMFITYRVNLKKQDMQFYWRNDKGENFGSIQQLKQWLETDKRKLVFAMNGGMYQQDGTPLGLYIEKGKKISPLNTSTGDGNFYLKPNGVFYITNDNTPIICPTGNFINNEKIKYATQSGPMLVIDGNIHNAFKEGSKNLNIRNGVGILADSTVVFAMSKKEINFYDFASYFKKIGCKNALYLDGFVSRTYLPEKQWVQTDGNFGVIVGVAVPAK